MKRFARLALCALVAGGVSVAAAASAPTTASGERRIASIDIDRIGPAAFASLRGDPRIAASVELGDRLLVEADAAFLADMQRAGRLLGTVDLAAGEQLTVHPRIHCDDHEEVGESKLGADVLGGDGRWHVATLPAGATKAAAATAMFAGESGHRTIAWQAGNRPAGKALAADAELTALAAAVDGDRWRARLATLETMNRQTGVGFNQAITLVSDEFAQLGMAPERSCFSSAAVFSADYRNCNISAVQAGRSDRWLIVGAHLDSRNQTWNDTVPSPGAEDNGSGCAGVVEVAQVLAGKDFEHNILYQCYGLEERGLLGSKAHAATLDPAKIVAMLNLDMIAFDGDGRLDISLQTTDAGAGLLAPLAELAATYTTLEPELATTSCCSDHMPYLERGIPAVLLIENDWNIYPQYHTVDDRLHRLSTDMARETIKLATVAAAQFAIQQDAVMDASGYWYDPAMSGHGWHFEVQADGSAVATWYTFDAAGAPIWIGATGPLVGNGATLEAFTVVDGRFPPDFDAALVQDVPWGTLEFSFSDCSHGQVAWNPNPSTGLPAGATDIRRISAPADNSCTIAR